MLYLHTASENREHTTIGRKLSASGRALLPKPLIRGSAPGCRWGTAPILQHIPLLFPPDLGCLNKTWDMHSAAFAMTPCMCVCLSVKLCLNDATNLQAIGKEMLHPVDSSSFEPNSRSNEKAITRGRIDHFSTKNSTIN